MKMFDYFFKTAIILIALGFLFAYYHPVNSNRFSYKWDSEEHIIFDSKKGTVYWLVGDKWVQLSPFEDGKTYPIKTPQK